jgi:membrane-associated phospholipid phosphatase
VVPKTLSLAGVPLMRAAGDLIRGLPGRLGSPHRRRRSSRRSAILIAAFVAVAVAVRIARGPIGPDLALHNWVVNHRGLYATRMARVITFTGGGAFVYPAAVVVALAIAAARRLGGALALCLTVGGGAAIVGAVKVIVNRRRPDPATMIGAREATMSFPSGHTASGALLFVGAALALGSLADARWPGTRVRPALLIVSCLWSAAIGWSRIYLGYHWLSDVLASWLLVGAILLAIAPLLRTDGAVDCP